MTPQLAPTIRYTNIGGVKRVCKMKQARAYEVESERRSNVVIEDTNYETHPRAWPIAQVDVRMRDV
jgi:hypothetical protein